MVLDELPLPYCDLFWGKSRGRIDSSEKLSLLSVTGGVPRYLEEIDPRLSADENIHRMCFRSEGILFREFDQIFNEVFGKREVVYREILRSLTHGSRTLSEISASLGKTRSGHITEYLKDLMLGGFASKHTVFDPKMNRSSRNTRYRLKDNYSRFFLRYVEPQRDRIEQGLMNDLTLDQLPGWSTVLGLQFENLVLGNLQAVIELLNIGKTPILSAAPYLQKPTQRKKGCQVDLLIATKHSLYLVEIKRRKQISSSVIDEVKQKASRISPGPGRSIRTALIYHGQLARGVEEEGYFDFIVPFDKLLETQGHE